MKNLLFGLFFLCFLSNVIGQESNLTEPMENNKSPFGLQVSTNGLWLFYEQPLFKNYSIRGEIGSRFRITSNFSESPISIEKIIARPEANLEFRRYFNGNSTSSLGKYLTSKGSYFAIQAHYARGSIDRVHWQRLPRIISNTNIDLTVTPYWGFKKDLNKNFEFEFGAGLGYNFYTDNNLRRIFRLPTKFGSFKPMLRVRAGYKF